MRFAQCLALIATLGTPHAGLLYAPGDEAALAASLQGLAADADRRQELAEAARTEAARHGWDWIARDVLERLGGEA